MTSFKIDENLPPFIAARLRDAGHHAVTVADQGLSGTKDDVLAPACQTEGRILVTLDLDFADIRAYPPGSGPGFVVLRLDGQDRLDFERAANLLVAALTTNELSGALWIVERDRCASAKLAGPRNRPARSPRARRPITRSRGRPRSSAARPRLRSAVTG